MGFTTTTYHMLSNISLLVSIAFTLLTSSSSGFIHYSFIHQLSSSSPQHTRIGRPYNQNQYQHLRPSLITDMPSTKSESDTSEMSTTKRPFRIRTITTFVTLHPDDLKEEDNDVFNYPFDKFQYLICC